MGRIKNHIACLVLGFVLAVLPSSSGADRARVSEYNAKDGNYVGRDYRTTPDNPSTKRTVKPYNVPQGTKVGPGFRQATAATPYSPTLSGRTPTYAAPPVTPSRSTSPGADRFPILSGAEPKLEGRTSYPHHEDRLLHTGKEPQSNGTKPLAASGQHADRNRTPLPEMTATDAGTRASKHPADLGYGIDSKPKSSAKTTEKQTKVRVVQRPNDKPDPSPPDLRTRSVSRPK